MKLAKGPSYWAAKEAADAAQREYDEAVLYKRPPHVINKARNDAAAAKRHLDNVERTGE